VGTQLAIEIQNERGPAGGGVVGSDGDGSKNDEGDEGSDDDGEQRKGRAGRALAGKVTVAARHTPQSRP